MYYTNPVRRRWKTNDIASKRDLASSAVSLIGKIA